MHICTLNSVLEKMLDSEKDLLVTTEVTVYRRRWYILTGRASI